MLAYKISSINYRIYANVNGFKLITVENKSFEVVSIVKNLAINKELICLVVEHDFELDTDTNSWYIDSEDRYYKFEEKMFNISKKTEKILKKEK